MEHFDSYSNKTYSGLTLQVENPLGVSILNKQHSKLGSDLSYL